MEKDEEPPAISEQQYAAMSSQLQANKKELFAVMRRFPKVGVYLNETHEEWDVFYAYFINFLRSEIGPRGECAKLVRSQLQLIRNEVDAALLPFNQTANTHIRQIYMKHKFFVPCEEYPRLIKLQEATSKYRQNLTRLGDKEGPMRRQIAEGLTAKHGPDYPLEQEFAKLQGTYEVKIQEAELEMGKLEAVLQQTQKYHEFMRVKQLMEPYFKLWVEADSGMGKENLKTGQAFEDKVNAEVLPYLLAREKNHKNWPYAQKKIEVFTNISWIPRNLGEIDIAFGYKDEAQDHYFIFTLIECKSRLFDLREAYKQVSLDGQEALKKGPTMDELKEMKRLRQLNTKKSKKEKSKKEEPSPNHTESEKKVETKEETKQEVKVGEVKKEALIQKTQVLKVEAVQEVKEESKKVINKKFLSTKYGPAELVEDHHFYMVTTLPQNEFILPIESKMKEGIEKYSKNRFIEDMESESLYQLLRQTFADRMSPLDWLANYEAKFREQEDSNILVLR